MVAARRGVSHTPLGWAALCLSGMSTGALAGAPTNEKGGRSKQESTEIVLALYDEDISWSDRYSDIRTVYCKGRDCPAGSIHLPNVGREGHTFLHHIVERYDSLADWTVFSQAEAPSEGYLGTNYKQRGGHLLNGIRFEDYLTSSDSDTSRFFLTSQVHLPSMQHSLRSTFKVSEETLSGPSAQGRVCPVQSSEPDHWGSFQEMPDLRQFLAKKCGLEESFLPEAMRLFWSEYLNMPIPEGQILQYAQGARFAVSRKQILSRPKEVYAKLLHGLSTDVDPCFNYILEWAWYYVFEGNDHPCELTTLPMTESPIARSLQDGGVSGQTVTEEVEAEQVSGNLGLDLGETSATDFCASASAMSGVKSYLSELTGVAVDQVDAACAERRLQQERRLAETVSIVYTLVILPDTTSSTGTTTLTADAVSAAITTAAADTSTMATSIASSLASAGVTVTLTVSEVSTPATATVTVTVTTVVYPTTTTPLLDMSTVDDVMQISATVLVTLDGDMAASDFCGRTVIQDAIVTFLQGKTSAETANIDVTCIAALGSSANLYIVVMGSTLAELTDAYFGLKSLEGSTVAAAFATTLDTAIDSADFSGVSATISVTSTATIGDVETTTTVYVKDVDGARPTTATAALPALAALCAVVLSTGLRLFS